MHIVYVHDAKIVKENGLTLQFCSNYPPKMSRIDAMYIFLKALIIIDYWSFLFLYRFVSLKIVVKLLQNVL